MKLFWLIRLDWLNHWLMKGWVALTDFLQLLFWDRLIGAMILVWGLGKSANLDRCVRDEVFFLFCKSSRTNQIISDKAARFYCCVHTFIAAIAWWLRRWLILTPCERVHATNQADLVTVSTDIVFMASYRHLDSLLLLLRDGLPVRVVICVVLFVVIKWVVPSLLVIFDCV